MVGAAAHGDGIFFKDPQVGGGFAGVQQRDAAALQQGHQFGGMGGDAAHALQKVQRCALTGKQSADIAAQQGQTLARFHPIAVGAERFHGEALVQQFKHAGKHLQACKYAALFADQLHLAQTGAVHHCVGRYILAGNVFFQSQQEIAIHIQLHRHVTDTHVHSAS